MADPISLSGKLDLAAVGSLHEKLLSHKSQDVTVSLADVTQLGALCAQVLISAANLCRSDGFEFKLINTNDRVLGQLAAMGMTPETIMEGSS